MLKRMAKLYYSRGGVLLRDGVQERGIVRPQPPGVIPTCGIETEPLEPDPVQTGAGSAAHVFLSWDQPDP